jgi:CHAT domain-containing protein
MVALEAGRAQALVEAGLIAGASLGGLCDDHATQFQEARRTLFEARQAEDRRALRAARDRFLAIRLAIRDHCAPDFLPDEPTYDDILTAPANGQALVYLAAADQAGFALILPPRQVTSQTNMPPPDPSTVTLDRRPTPILAPLTGLTRDEVDRMLVRRERSDAVTGGLLVAVQQQALDLLSVWLQEIDADTLRQKSVTAITEALPPDLATLRQALAALFASWRGEIARLQERLADEPQGSAAGKSSAESPSDARAREIDRLHTLTTTLDLTVDEALHDDMLRRELSWWYQRAELELALPRLSALITRPLRAALEAQGWGTPTQAIALIACERLSVAPLHAALVVDAQGAEAPLQETCELTFQASARTLARARATADALPGDGPVLSIGDPSPTRSAPLPHARFEAAGLAALAVQGGRSLSRALIGSAATLDATVAQLRLMGGTVPAQASLRGGWVDVASHGHADPTRLQSCFMVMADDEWLTLARLQSERLLEGARCFSASGCLTGLGDIIHAPDELGSFAAGAIQAGAAAVLATLWAVSDQANALLMLRVMELALTHPDKSPAWALREAARWLRSASRQDIALLRARVRTAIREMASATLNAGAAGEAQPALDAPPQDRPRTPDPPDRAAAVISSIITSDPEMDDGAMNATVARVRGVTRAVERIAVESASERMEASQAVRAGVPMGDEPRWDQALARPITDHVGAIASPPPPYAHPIYWAGVIAYGV